MGRYHGEAIPWEVYQGVPPSWEADAVRAEHARLGGVLDLCPPPDDAPPTWTPTPAHRAWLDYRATLYRMADGVRAGDPACAELAVRYIARRYIGSYSGYLRARLARALKHAALAPGQQQRLRDHFRALVLAGDRTDEMRDYLRLWRRLLSAEQREALCQSVAQQREEAGAWLARRLTPPTDG